MQVFYDVKRRAVARLFLDGRFRDRVLKVCGFKMHKVGGQLVLHAGVVLAATAEKDCPETVVGKAADDLVDPAGNAAADIGEGPLQKQHYVHTVRSWKVSVHIIPSRI